MSLHGQDKVSLKCSCGHNKTDTRHSWPWHVDLIHGARDSGSQRAWISANPVGLSQQRSGGHESAAGRRALSQRRSGGVITRERHAWGSGNPGTRQPAGGLGIATAGGGYLPRSAGMRASRPLDSRRSHRSPTPSCSGLWRDYERRLPCRRTDTNRQNSGTK